MVRAKRFQEERILYQLLDRLLSTDLVIVDGGARNGTRELTRVAKYTRAFSFEPNRDEYERILGGRIPPGTPAYKSIAYSPLALLGRSGSATLYITKRPAATSTLRPNSALLQHFSRDHWSQMQEVVRQDVVEGTSLRDFMLSQGLTYLDFIKLDTQGNELDILISSGDFLRKISVIKTEVEMIPLYREQPLFGDVAVLLARTGFELIDFQWTHPCRRYHFSPNLPLESYRLVWGEAIFAYEPFEFSGERKLEQAIVLAELGYVDVALYLLENLPSLSRQDSSALIDFYQRRKKPGGTGWLRGVLRRYLPERCVEALRVLLTPREQKEVPRIN